MRITKAAGAWAAFWVAVGFATVAAGIPSDKAWMFAAIAFAVACVLALLSDRP
jgi:mannose/fructose/N-acetylgalactosamine-specific phosphotransferase system component IIC